VIPATTSSGILRIVAATAQAPLTTALPIARFSALSRWRGGGDDSRCSRPHFWADGLSVEPARDGDPVPDAAG